MTLFGSDFWVHFHFVLSVSVEWWLTTKVSRTSMCNSVCCRFLPVSWSRAGALTQTEIIPRLWSECLFLLDTPTLPYFFKELKLKVSKCVFFFFVVVVCFFLALLSVLGRSIRSNPLVGTTVGLQGCEIAVWLVWSFDCRHGCRLS